jgi:hypothetical protein
MEREELSPSDRRAIDCCALLAQIRENLQRPELTKQQLDISCHQIDVVIAKLYPPRQTGNYQSPFV